MARLLRTVLVDGTIRMYATVEAAVAARGGAAAGPDTSTRDASTRDASTRDASLGTPPHRTAAGRRCRR
ncbi:hypothetical protein AB0D24_14360 [Streptomyces javensis]|uniref:hypothetical protein n=1 Tax=Streptomyces javensis TaxID=114698 RepID=UPI0033F0EA7C